MNNTFLINGEENNIDNFLDNTSWNKIWNITKQVMTYKRISNTTVEINFGSNKSLLPEFFNKHTNHKLKNKLTEECKKFNLSLKDN